MAMPLIMTGPGGDFVNRFEAQGSRIIKTRGRGSETESFTSTGQFARQPRRRPRTAEEAAVLEKVDVFEHTAELLQSGIYRMNGADPASGATTQTGHRSQTLADRLGAWLAAQRKALGQWHGPLPRHLHEPVPAELPLNSTDVARARARRVEAEVHRRAVAALMDDLLALTPEASDAPEAPDASASLETLEAATIDSPAAEAGDTDLAATLLETDHESFRESDPQTDVHSHPNPGPAPGTRLFADDAGARRRIGRQQSHRLRARRSPHQKGRFAAATQQGSLFGGESRL